MSDQNDVPWALLKPSWEILQDLDLEAQYDTLHPHEDMKLTGVMVKLPVGSVPSIDFKSVREAIELVSLLAQVNEQEWFRGLRTYATGLKATDLDDLPPLNFVVWLHGSPYVSRGSEKDLAAPLKMMQDRIAWLFTTFRLSDRTPAFLEAREQLLLANGISKTPNHCRQPTSITLKVDFSSLPWIEGFLAAADAIFRGQESLPVYQVDRALVLDAVDLNFQALHHLKPFPPQLRSLLMCCSVPLRRISIKDVEIATYFLGDIYGHGRADSDLSITSGFSDGSIRNSIFSALAINSTLKRLRITYAPDDDFMSNDDDDSDDEESELEHERSLVQWLAFALFSPHSKFSPTSMHLWISRLCSGEICTMERVLGASNPLQVLLNSSESEFRSVNLLVDVHTDTMLLPQGLTVWILHDRENKPTVEVFAPGLGIHSIQRSTLGAPKVLASVQRPPFHLELDVNRVEDVVGFFRLAGASLRGFTLVCDDGWRASPFEMVQIFRACPHLSVLRVSTLKISDLDCFVEAYESGYCRVQVLRLEELCLSYRRGAIHFLETLADPSSNMAQCLRELDLQLLVARGTIPLLQRLLKDNSVLTHITLRVPFKQVVRLEKALIHEPQYLAEPLKPLEMSAKLAFLSVVLSDKTKESRHSVEHMDSAVVSRIFTFAAYPKKRVISITSDE